MWFCFLTDKKKVLLCILSPPHDWKLPYLGCISYARLELSSVEMKKVYATLRALVEVMEVLSKDGATDGVGRLIAEEVSLHFSFFLFEILQL